MKNKQVKTCLAVFIVAITGAGFVSSAFAHCTRSGSSYIYVKNDSNDQLFYVGEVTKVGEDATLLKGFHDEHGAKYIPPHSTGELQACSGIGGVYPKGTAGLIDLADGSARVNVPVSYSTKLAGTGGTYNAKATLEKKVLCRYNRYGFPMEKVNYHCKYEGV